MSQTLNPGSHFGVLVDAALAAIGEKETPALVLTFEVTHEAVGGEWAPINPVRRDVQIWLSENAKERSFADLRRLGFNGNFDAPEFADSELKSGVELTVAHEHYNGKVQEKLNVAKLKTGRDRKAPAANIMHALAAQWKTAGGAKPSTPPPPARPAPAAAAAAAGEPPF